ncbi:MAG: hypothetical protein AB7Q16_17370 [Vicinamibacterales bacterium]
MPADEAHILVRLPAAINDRAIVGYDRRPEGWRIIHAHESTVNP